MHPRSVVGMFCEDIRSEKNGSFTLIGIMTDNAHVPAPPTEDQQAVIPKLCLYIRINFDAADTPEKIETKVTMADGNTIDLGEVSSKIIDIAIKGSRQKSNPIAVVILRAEFPMFPVKALGRIVAEVALDGAPYIAATLNLVSTPPSAADEDSEETRHFSQRF